VLLENAPPGVKVGCPGSIVSVPALAESEQRRTTAVPRSEERSLVIIIIAED
jgi:hypothetical protein